MTAETIALTGTSWLLTYAVHSSLLLVGVWALTRMVTFSHAAQELLWKAAMLGGLVTGGLHVATGGLGPSYALGEPADVSVTASLAALDESPAGQLPMVVPAFEPALQSGPGSFDEAVAGVGTLPVPSAPVAETSTTAGGSLPRVTWPLALSVLWLVGVLLAAARFLRARVRLAGLLRDRRPVQDPFLLGELEQLRDAAGLAHPVRLSWSPQLVAPVALRREICLPRRALSDLDPALRSGMLAHELAHVARQDSAWLHLTFGLRLAMSFQPLNRVAYRKLQELAEYQCDEWAVRHTGRRRAVAECLAEVAQWIDRSGRPIPLPSMAYDGSNLVYRVERILSVREDHQMLPRSIKLVSVVGAVAVFGAAAPGFAPHRADAPLAEDASLPSIESVLAGFDTAPAVPDAPVRPVAGPLPAAAAGEVAADRTPAVVALGELGVGGGEGAVQDTIDPRVVASLLNVLRDDDPGVRREAAEALGRLGAPTAVPGLITAMNDTATPVRAYAAWALGRIKDLRGMDPTLNAMIRDDSARVRKAAANAVNNMMSGRDRSTLDIARIGSSYAQLLTDEDADLRQAGISGLTELRLSQYGVQISRLMADPSTSVRRRAASALGRFRTPEGLAPLTAALADSSASVRRSVLAAIARYDTPASAAAVRRGLSDDSEAVRESAARLVGQRKDSTAFDALVAASRDPSADVRVASLRALRELRMPSAAAAYSRALGDDSRSVRSQGVAGLGELRDPAALGALGRAARDSSADVRELAVRSIHRIGDTTATPVLIRALSDPASDVRERAASALGDVRTQRAVAALSAALRDSIADVREQAIRALAKYNDAATFSAFVTALSDSSDDVREYAAQALGKLKDARAIAPLTLRVRSDESSDVRKRALRSLGAIGGANVVTPVMAALGDGSSEVRALAVNILGQLRDRRAVDPLMRALEDESSEVRRAATRALGRIQGR